MATEVLKRFGRRIKEERLRKHLSQEGLAELASLHRTYIGMIERAEKNITLLNMSKIANALGVDLKDLL
jgi:transcriptional regulator with XRE-family HTH domain